MDQFTHRGSRIAYDSLGEGPPLCVMHGLAAERGQTRGAFGAVRGRRILCPDMPGHGDSPLGEAGFAAYVEVVLALLDHLEIAAADLGGISMGGGIALGVALAAPGRVRSLLLVRPAWLDGPGLPHLGLIARLGEWTGGGPLDAARDRLEADPEMTAIAQENLGAANSIRAALTRPQAEVAARVLSALVLDRPFAALADLAKVNCDALVIGNDGDPLHPAALAQTLAAALPAARYRHLPSRYLDPAGHGEALLREVQSFLDGAAAPLPDTRTGRTPC